MFVQKLAKVYVFLLWISIVVYNLDIALSLNVIGKYLKMGTEYNYNEIYTPSIANVLLNPTKPSFAALQ